MHEGVKRRTGGLASGHGVWVRLAVLEEAWTWKKCSIQKRDRMDKEWSRIVS